MDLLTLNDKNEQFIVEDEHAQCLEGDALSSSS